MKKLISLLLAMMLATTYALPAGAVDDEEAEASPAPVTVTTAEELLEAIEAAEDGDTIIIGATISPADDTTIGNPEKRLTLIRSESIEDKALFSCNGSAIFENLLIDGNGGSERLFLLQGENVTLSGLTVRNSGGGAAKLQRGIITIEDCNFENNTAWDGGHLLVGRQASVVITGTTFNGGVASAGWGGAICSQSYMRLTDSVFTDNSASEGGGAIYTTSGGCTIRGGTITGNAARRMGGGGIVSTEALELYDTKIYGNTAFLKGADIDSIRNLNISISSENLAEV